MIRIKSMLGMRADGLWQEVYTQLEDLIQFSSTFIHPSTHPYVVYVCRLFNIQMWEVQTRSENAIDPHFE